MNWRSVCIIFGTACAIGGAAWLALGMNASVGWIMVVLGGLELVVATVSGSGAGEVLCHLGV